MNFLKRYINFETLLAATILAIHFYAAFSDAYNFPNAWFTRDDAYYYFKVAQNITEGHGSSFDTFNLTNGYHPLWMLVCIPIFFLARFDLILPLRVLLVVMGLLNAGTAILIYRCLSTSLSKAVAMAAAAFWAFNIYIHTTVYEFGLETPLAAFSIMLLLWNLIKIEARWRNTPVPSKDLIILGSLGAMVLLSRLDLVFLAVMAGIWIVFRGHSLRYLGPLDMVILFFSMMISVASRTGLEPYNTVYAATTLKTAAASMVINLIINYFAGLYQPPSSLQKLILIRRVLIAQVASLLFFTGVFICLPLIGVQASFTRSALLVNFGLNTVALLAIRLVAAWFRSKESAEVSQISPLSELSLRWKKWVGDGLAYFGVTGGVLVFYMTFNQIMFGTSSPVSGQIKRWWGSLPNTIYERAAHNWPSFFGVGYQNAFDAWQPLSTLLNWMSRKIYFLYPGSDTADERYFISLGLLILAGILLTIFQREYFRKSILHIALIPLVSGSAMQIFSYSTTAYGGAKEWYWISQMLLVTLGAGVFAEAVLQPLQKQIHIRRVTEIASISFVIFYAYQFGGFVKMIMPYNYFPPERPYYEVLPFLEENTPPGSVIGMTGGGNIGYFIKGRTIVNMDGLINSYEYFQALKNGTAPQYLSDHGVTIIFANAQILNMPPYYGQFDKYLERFNVYGGKGLLYLWSEPKY